MEMTKVGEVNMAFEDKPALGERENGTSEITVSLDSESSSQHGNDKDIDQKTLDFSEGFAVDPQTGDIIIPKKPFPKSSKWWAKCIARLRHKLGDIYQNHKKLIGQIIGFTVLLLYIAFVVYCLLKSDRVWGESSMRLLVGTIFGLILLLLHLGQIPLQRAVNSLNKIKMICPRNTDKIRIWSRRILYVVNLAVTVTLIIYLVALDSPRYLLSLAGLAALIFICFLTSHSPAMIEWHPVFWGVSFQFYMAVIILKTRWGFEAFKWLGDRIEEFVAYSDAGAKFVFGDNSELKFQDGTALTIKEAILSDGSTIPISSLLLSDESSVVTKGAFTVHFVAFGAQAPLLIKEYLGRLTSSELHAVMTGAFACLPSNMLGIYIGLGIPAQHLLAASVMSAPAALAISKITYPEIEIPIIKPGDYQRLESSKKSNLVEAASTGAAIAGKICVAIAVNMIAVLSLLKFVNATLTWFGDRAGVEKLTFEFICSYVLYPVALFTGTAMSDCRKVAELIGIKTFTNDFLAYSKLAELLDNRNIFQGYVQNPNNTWHKDGDDIYLHGLNNKLLEKGVLEPRSEVIAVYALCGLTNVGAMGVLLGGMTALAPHRFPTMSRLVLSAMVAGNVANIANGCIAGLLYEEF